ARQLPLRLLNVRGQQAYTGRSAVTVALAVSAAHGSGPSPSATERACGAVGATGRMADDVGGGKRGQLAMSVLLVMSDDVDVRLASYLLAQIDQHVVTAGTLAEARRYLSERVWSAVILDTVLAD